MVHMFFVVFFLLLFDSNSDDRKTKFLPDNESIFFFLTDISYETGQNDCYL